jgi:phage FluMu protein Com
MPEAKTFRCPHCEALLGEPGDVTVTTQLVQEPIWTPWNPRGRGGQHVVTIISCPACEKAIGAASMAA